MSDEIPTAREVEVTATNLMTSLLIRLRRNGWLKRQGVKVGAFVAAAVAGWLAGHGGQEYAAEAAAGAGAIIIFGWESLWSWIEFKTCNVKIIDALNTTPPENRLEAITEIRRLAAKDPSPPVVPAILLCLICVVVPACCKSRQPSAQTGAVPFTEAEDTEWYKILDDAVRQKLAQRYQSAK